MPGYKRLIGRSEAALESYFLRLEGKEQVRIVCMDLAVVYRPIVRKHFPKAVIVADRFHVIRLVNHHFLACWRDIDPAGAKNRGLLSLMRRHRHKLKPEQKTRLLSYLAERPALQVIYRFKQRLCYLLLKKHKTRRQCQRLVPRFLRAIDELRQSGLAQRRNSSHSATLCTPGLRRLHGCGALPGQTALPKAFTTKWRRSAGRRTASTISKIIASECRCYVLRMVWDWGLPPQLAESPCYLNCALKRKDFRWLPETYGLQIKNGEFRREGLLRGFNQRGNLGGMPSKIGD